MPYFSRRSFLLTSSAVPFATLLGGNGIGKQPPAVKRIRYEARTPQGIAMLKVYAQGVKAMKARAEGDPRNWGFQWYSHYVNGDTTKQAEIARIYKNPGDPNKAIAEAMWNTCQAHDGQNEDFFLPWHRCFVLYFEQIIATLTDQKDFALPYWNYSTSDATRGVIPPQFTNQNDVDFGSLYDGKRNPGVNQLQQIQKGQSGDPLSLSALTQKEYSSNDTESGFCQELDNTLHGAVHVLVGNTQNMGDVPYAAQDPIFWLHHCNIDRLWASWNVAGYKNPKLSQNFAFVDGSGNSVNSNISDFLDLSKLDYSYDRLEPVPGPSPLVKAVAPAKKEMLATLPQTKGVMPGVTLKGKTTRVSLEVGPEVRSLTARVTSLESGRHTYLLVSGLSTKLQPGSLYSLYLDLPDQATNQQLEDHLIGTINFFGVPHAENPHGVMKGPDGKSRFLSFEITGKLRALGHNKALNEKPILTIIRNSDGVAESQPMIGNVELVTR